MGFWASLFGGNSRPAKPTQHGVVRAQYVELKLLLRSDEAGDSPSVAIVRTKSDPRGFVSNESDIPVDIPSSVWSLAEDFKHGKLDEHGAAALGRMLAKIAFVDHSVLGAINASRAKSVADDENLLRVVFAFKTMDALGALPWELVYLPEMEDGQPTDWTRFLALDRRISLVRQMQHDAPRFPARPPSNAELLLVLSPVGTQRAADLHEQMIRGALALNDRLRLLEPVACKPASFSQLQRIVRGKTVVHLFGHGSSAAPRVGQSPEGRLALVAEDLAPMSEPLDSLSGNAPTDDLPGGVWIPAASLASELSGATLAVLSACYGATTVAKLPMYGMCATVSRTGVPAVVGMQAELLVSVSHRFAKAFYEYVGVGECIDFAMSMARVQLGISKDRRALQAFVPVLFQNFETRAVGVTPLRLIDNSRDVAELEGSRRADRNTVARVEGLCTLVISAFAMRMVWLGQGYGVLFWSVATASVLLACLTLGTYFFLDRHIADLISDRKRLEAMEGSIKTAAAAVAGGKQSAGLALDLRYRRLTRGVLQEGLSFGW